jgi:hypothetical protein
MKKSAIVIFFLTLFFFLAGRVEAGSLRFDKTTVSVEANNTFEIQVVVDAGSDQVNSTSAYVNYDATVLQAQSVTAGTFFSTVTNNITSGQVYLIGLIDTVGDYRTGSGTLATITFKSLKNGEATLSFLCQTGSSTTSTIIKNDINATNLITCSENGTTSVTVGAGGSSNPTPTPDAGGGGGSEPTPTALPKSGAFDSLPSLLVLGLVLMLVGGGARLIL